MGRNVFGLFGLTELVSRPYTPVVLCWTEKTQVHSSRVTLQYSEGFLGHFFVFLASQFEFGATNQFFREGLIHDCPSEMGPNNGSLLISG